MARTRRPAVSRSLPDFIGTEHILLGLIREGDGLAAQILVKLGADLKQLQSSVLNLLKQPNPGPPSAAE
jgi:ATP-dependent Clp protease ATP-binding subunit ClpC